MFDWDEEQRKLLEQMRESGASIVVHWEDKTPELCKYVAPYMLDLITVLSGGVEMRANLAICDPTSLANRGT